MLRLASEIIINEITFNAVIAVEIESSWEQLTDTCRLEIPNNFKRNGKNITVGDEGFFKRGDKAIVKLGYFPNLNTEFEGYIRKIYVDNVVVIELEDAAFLLKKEALTFTQTNTDVETVLNKITNNGKTVSFNVENSDLGTIRATNATAAKVLEELKKTYGLISYIKEGVLRCGLAYYPDEANTINLDFENNIIEQSLEQTEASDLPLIIKGITATEDDKAVIRYAYYNDNNEIEVSKTLTVTGEVEEFKIQTPISASDLETYIKRRLEARQYSGSKGTITTFLEPSVKHGDIVKLTSRKFPEKEGEFVVKKVVKNFGLNGGRQEITLAQQLN